jgi:transcriptional regulator with XRE-family HTH domain
LRVTQEELAELAGVSVRSVASIEAGKPTVRLDILLPVLATLGVDVVERIERA